MEIRIGRRWIAFRPLRPDAEGFAFRKRLPRVGTIYAFGLLAVLHLPQFPPTMEPGQ